MASGSTAARSRRHWAIISAGARPSRQLYAVTSSRIQKSGDDSRLSGERRRAALRVILKQKQSGRIINIGSVVGSMGNAGQANYVTSKAGLIGLTKALAREVAARGVTVNLVAPGFIETDMTANLPDAVKETYRGQIPLGRFGTAADVAAAVAFLVSDGAAYITGQVIHVNGGMWSS